MSRLQNTLYKRIGHIILTVLIIGLSVTCKMFEPGLGEAVDLESPELTINSHQNGAYVAGSITLSGAAKDDIGIKSISIDRNGDVTAATYSNGEWSMSLDTSKLPDGDHEFVISAIDSADKVSSIAIYLIVDNNAPTVLVNLPGTYGSTVEYNKNIAIKGEATDTTRVKEVLVSMYKASDNSAVFVNEPATGTSSWYYMFDAETLNGGLDGEYYFVIKASDYSGNTNSFFYHFNDILNISADPASVPNVEDINGADVQGKPIADGVLTAALSTVRKSGGAGKRMSILVNADSDLPQFIFVSPSFSVNPAENTLASPQRLSGFTEDDDGLDYDTLKVALWNYADNPNVDLPLAGHDWVDPDKAGNQWSYSTSLADGEYWLKVRVSDIYGTEATSSPVAFKVSAFAPVLNVTAPSQGIYVGNDSVIDLEIQATALSSGIVELDPNGDNNYSDALPLTDQGGGVWTRSIQAGVDFTVLPGEQLFRFRGGTPGNYGNTTLQYTGDTAIPGVTLETPADGSSVNGTFNLTGTASDNYVISSVYLWIEEDGDPATDPPADVSSWLTPTGSNLYNWIYALDSTTLNSGGHTIHITAYDAGGNRSTAYSKSIFVDQDSDRPVVSFSNLTAGGTAFENGLSRDASFIGSIEDDDKVDVSTIEVRIDLYNDGLFPGVDLTGSNGTNDPNESEDWEIISNPPANDAKIVTWSHILENVPQGEHAMWIRVHDLNSSGTADTGTNPNYAETLKTVFMVDFGPPDLSITQPVNNSLFNSDFTISGTAADANGLSDIEISLNGGAFSSVMAGAPGSTNSAWQYDFTVAADGSDDGSYAYQIQATDMSGSKTTLDRNVIVDATAPVITQEQPSAGNMVNGNALTIRGTGNDNRDITTVYLDINPDGTAAEADPALWDYTADGTYSWSKIINTLDLNNTAAAANYVISAAAFDSAGNMSSVLETAIVIDQTSDRPVITFSDLDKDETVAANNVLVGATSLTGLIEDDDLIDPALFGGNAIEININDGGWQPVSNPPAASGKVVVWKHNISALGEGSHKVKLRVRDNQSDGTYADASSEAAYTSNFNWNIEDSIDQGGIPFILNLGPPNIVLTNPANYSYHKNDVLINGTASDANGVSTVEISLDNGSNWIDLGVTPGNSVNWTYTLTVNSDGSDDDTYAYLVRATDAYGSTGIENGQFTVDATKPTILVNRPSAGETVNGTITFEGTASDNIKLDEVYYKIQPQLDPVPLFPDDYILFAGNYSWNDTMVTPDVADGTYTMRIIAVDSAGNISDTSTTDFDVDQSTDKPLITFSSISAGGTFSDNLLPASKQVIGTIIDDDSVDVGTIEYKLFEEDGTTLHTDWTPINGAPGSNTTLATFVHTFSGAFPDGKYQLQLRASDTFDAGARTAGGFGWTESSPVRFAVDTANPETTITSPSSNGGYTNQDFTVSGQASDAGGVKQVKIQFNSDPEIVLVNNIAGPYNTTENWSYNFDVDTTGTHNDDGVLNYTITVIDAYDKIKTIDRYINIDTVNPVINSLVLVNNDQTGGDTVNGSVLLQGAPADNETLISAVYLKIDSALPPEPGADPTAEADPWTLLPGTTSINYRFKSTDLTEFTGYTAYFLAEDLAGNRTAVGDYTLSMTPDQSGNTPVLTIDTPDNSLLTSSGRITGTITDDDGVDVSTIEISTDGGVNWNPVSAPPASDSTYAVFSHALDSVASPAVTERTAPYSVMVRASDTGEDFVDDTQDIPPASVTSGALTIKVDDSDPTSSITLISNGKSSSPTLQGIYVNDSFTIEGTALDGVRIADVRAMIDGDADFVSVNNTGTDFDTWDWSRTGLSLAGDSVQLSMEIEDFHGKVTPYSYTILVDQTAPSASFISNTATVHGTYNIRGTASDNILVSKVYLAHGTTYPDLPAGGNPETDPDYTALPSVYSWNYDLDTLGIHPADTDLPYYATVVAVDGAGNVSARDDYSFTINQGSDRPNISFSNVTPGAGGTLNLLESNAKILGSADDDDGLASIEMAVSADDITFSAYAPVTSDGSTAFPVSGINLNWQSFVADLGEGLHYAKFRIRDTEYVDAGTPFNEVETASFAFTIDTSAPAVNMTDFDIDHAYLAATTINKPAVAGTLINNSFLVTGTVTDGNNISSVQISTDGTNFEDVDTLTAPAWSHSIPITRNGLGAQDGTLTIYVSATDEFLKTTNISLPVTIDTLEPEILATQPAGMNQADPPDVNGPTTLRGTITEVSAITSFDAIAGINDDIILTNSGTPLNWVLDVDTDLYANSSYATEYIPVSTSIWRLPIDISAEDAAGNMGAELFHIDIDPDSDKPRLNLATPSDGSSVAGAFIVQGTVSDDDDIQKVTIQVDLNNDGSYDASYDLDGSGTTGDSNFENESVPLDLTVSNGTWSILMNQSNEFTKSNLIARGYAAADGWIGLRIIPYDVDNSRSGSPNLAGDPTDLTLYIDSTAPIIEGQAGPLPTPSNGSIVNDTVTLKARFKDDQELADAKMQISFDGGVSFQSVTAAGGVITENGLQGGYYEYDIDINVDTTNAGGIVSGGNGILQTVFKVTDETIKQNSLSLQLNVDNTLPTGEFNYNDSLNYFGPEANKVYSFDGNAALGGNYMLIGSSEDVGTISGVEGIEVFFVKSGNFYNPKTGATTAVSNANLPDMSGVEASVPYTTDSSYFIDINTRSERGIYDTDPNDGDDDGFQESLKSKGTYDEWYVFFDTTVFPDGPMDLYTVVRDTAGNKAYEKVSMQIANNPPLINSVEIDGLSTLYSGLFKATNSLYLKINASSTEGLVPALNRAILSKKIVAPDGANTTDGPTLGTVYDIAAGPDGNDEITIDMQESGDFVSNVVYTFTVEVTDINGNISTTDIDVWLDNLDTVFPTVDIDDFDQTNVSVTAGHIESSGQSNNDSGTSDADLSGTVRITGTAWDDNAVDTLEIRFGTDATAWTSWTTIPAGNITLTSSSVLTGKDYSWYYDWNTVNQPVAGEVTAEDINIEVRASDTSTFPSANQTTDSLQVDVIPYITDIQRNSNVNTNRSKYGKYMVQQDETGILINGYNLRTGDADDWLRIYDTTGTSFENVTVTSSASAPNQLTVSMAGITASGFLRISVENMSDGNYQNDNGLSQNMENTDSESALWNDDRYLYVWDVSEAFGGSKDAEYPAMSMNTSNGNLIGSWAHYLTTSMRASTPTTTPASVAATTIETSVDMFEYNDIAVDTGNAYHMIYLDNLYYGTNWGTIRTYDSSGGTAWIEIMGDDQNDSIDPSDGMDEYLYQFKNPKIMVEDDYNYVVYYDTWAQALKFAVTSNNARTFVPSSRTGNGTFFNPYVYSNISNGYNIVAGEEDTDTNPDDSGDDVGLYSAIAMDKYHATGTDNRIVTVFYNETQNKLQLARGSQQHGAGSPALNNNNSGHWTIQDVPLGSYAGQYVEMAIDSTGGLHIVAYRISNGDLLYIHADNIDGTTAAYSFDNPVVVDSTGNVGKWVDLTLFNDKPYISYLSGDLGTFDGAKFAWYQGDGSSWESAGDWEYGIVPSDTPVLDKRTSIEASNAAAWGEVAIGYGSDYYSLAYLLGEQ
ncbi:MAG: Ig-like domain-containing protein [Spirochaetales bacterium]|nr:Ig-like domain-containing protein [Spirochaetales bacterium]